MYVDANLKLSDSQALTATALSTNVIDLSVASAIGAGEAMTIMICVEVDADQSTGDEDYTFDVEFASDSGITTDRQLIARRIFESGTPTAPAQDADLLVDGFKLYLDIPSTAVSEVNRYLAVRYTLAGTSPSVTVSTFLTPKSFGDSTTDYASAYEV